MSSPLLDKDAAEMAAMLGGVALTVRLRGPDGATEEAFVEALDFERLPLFGHVIHDEPRLVELVCRKEKGWAARLVQGDAERIAILGRELNEPPFYRWADRQSAALEKEIAKLGKLAAQRNSLPGFAPSVTTPRPSPGS